MSDNRRQILDALRATQTGETPLPAKEVAGIRYPDPWQKFGEVLQQVGGELRFAPQNAFNTDYLRATLPYFRDAAQICSLLPNVTGNVALAEVDDPHSLKDLDVVVAPGRLAVAENAAVWVDDEQVRQRVVYFIARRLILVVDRENIVHNLHEAYEQLSFSQAGFGTFISGPSKTADIEQSLVIGAHGPRSLGVFCLTGDA